MTSSVHKNSMGKIYIDCKWFGRMELSSDVRNNTIIETRKGVFGRIRFYEPR